MLEYEVIIHSRTREKCVSVVAAVRLHKRRLIVGPLLRGLRETELWVSSSAGS